MPEISWDHMEENHLSRSRMSVRAIPWPLQHLCIRHLRDPPVPRKGWQRALLLLVSHTDAGAAGLTMLRGQPQQLCWVSVVKITPAVPLGTPILQKAGRYHHFQDSVGAKFATACRKKKSLLVHMLVQCNWKSAQSTFVRHLHFLNR